MRINKFVALSLGIARRTADDLIIDSKISVNGKPAKNGQDVDERLDVVEHLTDSGESKRILMPQSTGPRVLLMYKPPKILTSHENEGGNKTIYDILPAKYHSYKFAGRLDLMSEGLLVLSNDGGAINTMTHPRYGHTKKYLVVTEKLLSPKDLAYLAQGIEIDGYVTRPSKITPLLQSPKDYKKFQFLGIHVHQPTYIIVLGEGRNQQIRKMMFAVNTKVKRLIRVEFGSYSLDAKLLKGSLQEMPWKPTPTRKTIETARDYKKIARNRKEFGSTDRPQKRFRKR